MSQSPNESTQASREAYELGWVRIHRLLREGRSWSGRERHAAFLNTRDGRFADVSHATGFDFSDDGRAVVRLDWDRDGAPDLALTSRGSPRLRLLRTAQTASGERHAFRLVGTRSNRDAVGARLVLRLSNQPPIVRAVRCGEGYLAQSTRALHVSLPPGAQLEEVSVRWPDGSEEVIRGIDGPGLHTVVEGSGLTASADFDPRPELQPVPVTADPRDGPARVALAAPLPMPMLECLDPDGAARPWLRPERVPCLILLWAEWCAPCQVELRALVQAQERLEKAGLHVLALDVEVQSGRDLLTEIGWPYERARATPEILETLDLLQRSLLDRQHELALPTSFLVDERGRLTHVLRGGVEVDALLSDVARLGGTPEEFLAGAVPFPGRWVSDPPVVDLTRLARLAGERGLERVAAHFERAAYQTSERSEAQVLVRMGTVHARQGDLERAADLFAQAAEKEPSLEEAWSNLAAALHQSGRVRESIPAYGRALALDGRDGATRYNLALARAALGEGEQALDELRSLELISSELAAELEDSLRAQGIQRP